MSEVPTLYDWAGGRTAIERMIDCFYNRVERDDLLSRFFPGGVSAAHREHVTTWWCEVFGGPAGYTEQLGGYPAMLAHHRDLGITADQRFRFASLMSLAADDADLPSDPEFRAALGLGRCPALPALTGPRLDLDPGVGECRGVAKIGEHERVDRVDGGVAFG